mgnify:FL=1
MKITKRQLRRLVMEQDDVASNDYQVSSDVKMKDSIGVKKGKVRSKQHKDSEASSQNKQTNLSTGVKRSMTNLVGDFNKTKKIGNLTTGDKRVQYHITAVESEGDEKDYFFYDMYVGKESKLKKADVLIRLSNHPNSSKPGKITYQVGKHPNLKPASPLKAILKLKLMGVNPKELIDIIKDLSADVDVNELQVSMKKAVNHKAEDYKTIKEVKMKITKRQLRKLIMEMAMRPPHIPTTDPEIERKVAELLTGDVRTLIMASTLLEPANLTKAVSEHSYEKDDYNHRENHRIRIRITEYNFKVTQSFYNAIVEMLQAKRKTDPNRPNDIGAWSTNGTNSISIRTPYDLIRSNKDRGRILRSDEPYVEQLQIEIIELVGVPRT